MSFYHRLNLLNIYYQLQYYIWRRNPRQYPEHGLMIVVCGKVRLGNNKYLIDSDTRRHRKPHTFVI